MCTPSAYQLVLQCLGIGAIWFIFILLMIYGIEWIGFVFKDDNEKGGKQP